MTVGQLQKMIGKLAPSSDVFFGVSDDPELYFNLNRTAVEFPDAEPETTNFVIYLDRLDE